MNPDTIPESNGTETAACRIGSLAKVQLEALAREEDLNISQILRRLVEWSIHHWPEIRDRILLGKE